MAGYDAITKKLNTITEIRNKVYPAEAPKGQKAPYVVYERTNKDTKFTLDDSDKLYEEEYDLNVIHTSYMALQTLADNVVDEIEDIEGTTVNGTYYQMVSADCGTDFLANNTGYFGAIISVKMIY